MMFSGAYVLFCIYIRICAIARKKRRKLVYKVEKMLQIKCSEYQEQEVEIKQIFK